LSFGIDRRVFVFATLLSLASSVLCGLLPALGATRVDLIPALTRDGEISRHGFKRSRLRSSLVVAQVASSMVLLIVAGLFVRSLASAESIDPGFEHNKVLAVSLDLASHDLSAAQRVSLYDRLLEAARSIPGVVSASIEDCVPLTMTRQITPFWIEDRIYSNPDDESISIDFSTVSSRNFETMGIPLLRGRDFSSADTSESPGVAIVNQAFVERYWPGANAIGKRIGVKGSKGPFIEVVGVSATIKHWMIGEQPRPYVYLPLSQRPRIPLATLLLRAGGDPLTLALPVRTIIRDLEPSIVLSNTSRLTHLISFVLLPARFAAAGFGLFGFLALALASIGLYGLMSYNVQWRRFEMSVRIALGAQRSAITRLILMEGLRLTALGLAIGLALAFAGTRLLSSLLYGIGTTDPATFLGVSLLLIVAALLACGLSTRRMIRVDPAVALKCE
jgi:predicted permease